MERSSYDAIVILGGGVDEQGRLNDAQKQRIDDAIKLQASGQAAVMILSGAYSYKAATPPVTTEAAAMRDYVLQRGVPAANVYIEAESKDTLGNFYFIKTTLLIPHDWRTVYVVPSAGHLEERLRYISDKVLGPDYTVSILKFTDNTDPANLEREHRSYSLLQEWLHSVMDGDHEAIMDIMRRKHPGYSDDSQFTAEQLERLIG